MKNTSYAKWVPPEWYKQSAVLLAWPTSDTDWAYILDEVIEVYVKISAEIVEHENLIIICQKRKEVLPYLKDLPLSKVRFVEMHYNDTWARDFAPITVLQSGKPVLLNFKFNGWGGKFDASFDNLITNKLWESNIFHKDVVLSNKLDFVLEGGSVEFDGNGTLLTTTACLSHPGRNPTLDQSQISERLTAVFGVEKILWLSSGNLIGDDTDSHIDTLARFCPGNTIVYVNCDDDSDDHFEDLQRMKQELKHFTNVMGQPYKLVALPMADICIDEEGNRLPASYANFLICNTKVLLPFYGSEKDFLAEKILGSVFPNHTVVGINCLPLIKQNGSLHCITMQFPQEVILA